MTALDSLAQAWGPLALTITWQLALLAVLVWLCEWALRLRQARVRHTLWWCVLVAPLLLAPARLALEQRAATVAVPAPAPVVRAVGFTQSLFRPAAPPLPSGEIVSGSLPVASPPTPARDFELSVGAVLLAVWLLGCAVVAARLLLGHRWLRRLLAASEPVSEGRPRELLEKLCQEAGVGHEIALRSTTDLSAPVLYGVRRPVILLPKEWLDSLSPEDLRVVLAHELAHVKRGDVVANLLQRLSELPLFFHPAAWLAGRRIMMAREELCDAVALGDTADPRSYALSLLAVAEKTRGALAMASVGVAEGRFTLLRRVEAIMAADIGRRFSRTAGAVLGVLVLAAAVAVTAIEVRSAAGGGEGREQLQAESNEPEGEAPAGEAGSPSDEPAAGESADQASVLASLASWPEGVRQLGLVMVLNLLPYGPKRLDEGASWTYDMDGQMWTFRIVEVAPMPTGQGTRVTTEVSSEGVTELLQMRLSENRESLFARVPGVPPSASPREPEIAHAELRPGARWQCPGMALGTIADVASLPLSTPAGEFPKAASVSVDFGDAGRGAFWFASGVGLVAVDETREGRTRRVATLTGYRAGRMGEGIATASGLPRGVDPGDLPMIAGSMLLSLSPYGPAELRPGASWTYNVEGSPCGMHVVEVAPAREGAGLVVTAELSMFGSTTSVQVALSPDRRSLSVSPGAPILGPLVAFTLPQLKAGDRWLFLGQQEITVHAVVTRRLSTTAGEFADAVRVGLGGQREEGALWFAPGVGLVALEDDGRTCMELTAYRPGDRRS